MADPTRRARGGQDKSGDDDGPVLEPGRLYTRPQIIKRMGITAHTFSLWKKAGMQVFKPGTKFELVFADDVMAIVRMPRETLGLRYKSPHAEKNKSRKKPE